MATIHAVGPSYVVGQHSKNAVDVPCIEAVIDALQNLDVVSHQRPFLVDTSQRSAGTCSLFLEAAPAKPNRRLFRLRGASTKQVHQSLDGSEQRKRFVMTPSFALMAKIDLINTDRRTDSRSANSRNFVISGSVIRTDN
jgi:hypothetical protein